MWRGPWAQATEGLWEAKWLLEPPKSGEGLIPHQGPPAGPGAAGELDYNGEGGGKLTSGDRL